MKTAQESGTATIAWAEQQQDDGYVLPTAMGTAARGTGDGRTREEVSVICFWSSSKHFPDESVADFIFLQSLVTATCNTSLTGGDGLVGAADHVAMDREAAVESEPPVAANDGTPCR